MKNEITSKRLQSAMDQQHMKAQELSTRSGLNKASISQYINGTHAPSNISAGKMAAVLNVNPVWLMGYDVPMARDTMQGPVSYYMDEETAALAQEMFEDPDMRSLFSMKRNMDPKQFQNYINFMKAQYALEHPED